MSEFFGHLLYSIFNIRTTPLIRPLLDIGLNSGSVLYFYFFCRLNDTVQQARPERNSEEITIKLSNKNGSTEHYIIWIAPCHVIYFGQCPTYSKCLVWAQHIHLNELDICTICTFSPILFKEGSYCDCLFCSLQIISTHPPPRLKHNRSNIMTI